MSEKIVQLNEEVITGGTEGISERERRGNAE